ncbi:hypothetical protein ADIAG_02650 [Paeniglutamicibacter gangotriensis Lz1y]|uniref:Uncharacterized protein n=2 Tax=Paeniglutamicibacter gangotriensis TaxID=254787 RepID=M7N8N5_9MICC|nr:hypothetical protein ADIAG_02650 [Paeniglutamicibacter gangotriensis Lz1y]
MAGKRTGFMARWLARRAEQGPGQPGVVHQPVDPSPPTPAPAAAHDPTYEVAPDQEQAAEPGVELPAASAPGATDEATIPEPQPEPRSADEAEPVPVPPSENDLASADAAGNSEATEDSVAGPDAASATSEDTVAPAAANEPETLIPEILTPETVAERTGMPDPAVREQKVITIVSLVPHSGAKTLCAALEGRVGGRGWQIRTAGPGLMRAAFLGMLTDTDALLLIAPAEAEVTQELGERLEWLELNNRPSLPERTIFVLNRSTGEGGPVQLPADLSRPVVLLPFDPALSLPRTSERAPRRAARHALAHLIDELTTLIQEH